VTQHVLLGSQDGENLGAAQLTTVSLNPTAAVSSTSTAAAKPERHVNAGFFAVSAVLIVIAVVLFWAMSRSAKNTTD
jgi:hypothetical protein